MAAIKKNNDKMNLLHVKNLANRLNELFQIIFISNSLHFSFKNDYHTLFNTENYN